MASMAAAAYYQQLSLSFGGGHNTGISSGQFLPSKEMAQTPSSQIAAAFASNPYFFQSLPSPPSSAQVSSLNGSIPLSQIPFQRYQTLPEQLTLSNSPFLASLNLNLHNQINSNDVSHMINANIQNGLQMQETFGEKTSNSDKYNGSRQQQQALNENSFWTTNYGSFPSAWNVNQLCNFNKGN